MRDYLFSVVCEEPEGVFVRRVRFAVLTPEKLRHFYEKLSRFPTLFNLELVSVDDFIQQFIRVNAAGEVEANGIVWEVDDVGLLFITDISPGYQATGHFSFWDRRFRGREELIRRMLKYLFDEYGFHRIVTEVPVFANPTLAAVERCGFVREGRLRKTTKRRGEWFDSILYSILEEEINGIQADDTDEAAEVTGHSASG